MTLPKPIFKILDVLGLVFDADIHRHPLPNVKTKSPAPKKVQPRKPDNLVTLLDGKDYIRIDNLPDNEFEYDSSIVPDSTGRMSTYYPAVDDVIVRHYGLDKDKYQVLKPVWARGKSYRAAGKDPAVKNLKGCGQRKRADYWKAFNHGHRIVIGQEQAPTAGERR